MKRLFTSLLLSLTVLVAFAQVEITKSTEKVNINGTIYYVHKVLPKQTIYSICKTYDIGSEELMSANPSLSEGLKAGAIIYIPTKEKTLVETQIENNQWAEESDEDVSEEIDVKTGAIEHTVKWTEVLLIRLAAMYNVSVDDIVAYNNLSNKIYVKPGQKILIPKVTAVQAVEQQEESEEDEIEDAPETIVIDPANAQAQIKVISAIPHFSEANPLKVSLLLSLNSQASVPSSSYYDLYSGALMALEELKSEGLSVNLKVIDVTNNNILNGISNDLSIKNSDIVIGPTEASKISSVASICQANNIPFVSMLDSKAESMAVENPYFFQMQSSEDQRLENMINSINIASDQMITIIYNADGSEKDYVTKIKALLDAREIKYHDVKYDILQGRTIIESLKSRYSTVHESQIIVASETEAFASDAIRNLWLLKLAGHPLKVYCSSKVRNFETIEQEILYEVNAHMSSQYFVDYGSDEVKDFILKYRALFNSEPSSYSFHGYDTFKFFLTAFKDLGREHFIDYIPYLQMSLLQTDLKFGKINENGGYINTDSRNVEYNLDQSIDIK